MSYYKGMLVSENVINCVTIFTNSHGKDIKLRIYKVLITKLRISMMYLVITYNYYHYQPGSKIIIIYFKHIVNSRCRRFDCSYYLLGYRRFDGSLVHSTEHSRCNSVFCDNFFFFSLHIFVLQ